MMANFIALMHYFKTAKFILRGAPRYIFVADKMFQPRVANGGAEGFELFARAFGGQFDAAVGQITHNAGNFKSGGDGFRGVAKTDTLHMAGIKNLPCGSGLQLAFVPAQRRCSQSRTPDAMLNWTGDAEHFFKFSRNLFDRRENFR